MWDGTYESNKRQQGKGDNGTALQNIRSYVFTEKNEYHFFDTLVEMKKLNLSSII